MPQTAHINPPAHLTRLKLTTIISFFTMQKLLQGKLWLFSLSMPSFSCTFCSKHQDSEIIIIPMSNIAKKIGRLQWTSQIQNKRPGEMGKCFCHPFRFDYKAGTDCKCMAAQCVTVGSDKHPFWYQACSGHNQRWRSHTCTGTFPPADRQAEESQRWLLVLSFLGAAPFSEMLTSHLISVQG